MQHDRSNPPSPVPFADLSLSNLYGPCWAWHQATPAVHGWVGGWDPVKARQSVHGSAISHITDMDWTDYTWSLEPAHLLYYYWQHLELRAYPSRTLMNTTPAADSPRTSRTLTTYTWSLLTLTLTTLEAYALTRTTSVCPSLAAHINGWWIGIQIQVHNSKSGQQQVKTAEQLKRCMDVWI
jgi:hypothetical protein